MLRTIVSGGQTGADRAAFDVALEHGLEISGWVPAGRGSETGRIPDRYPHLRETESRLPAERTYRNARDSDATLVLTHGPPFRGTALTVECAERLGRPLFTVDFQVTTPAEAAPKVRSWIEEHGIVRLNVAGPRQSEDPDIYAAVEELLRTVLGDPPDAK